MENLGAELGVRNLSSILSTLSVPLVSREVICAMSPEASLPSELQKAVLSVHAVITVFCSKNGKIENHRNKAIHQLSVPGNMASWEILLRKHW